MDIIIRKDTDSRFEGRIVKKPSKCCRMDGELIDYWLFEVNVNGQNHIWECHSDYWELIDDNLNKTLHMLKPNESQETNVLEKIKKILRWGFCK